MVTTDVKELEIGPAFAGWLESLPPDEFDMMQSLIAAQGESEFDSLLSDLLDEAFAEGVELDTEYRFDPQSYIEQRLRWRPWSGTEDHPGQAEVVTAYRAALLQQWEKYHYELGHVTQDALQHWKPGQTIKNWIRVESGHLIGKTKVAAGLFSHFLDCFQSIIYTFAPSDTQINDLLWKEIREDRRDNGRPGRVQEIPRLRLAGGHFAVGRATNDNKGTGLERLQGQHHPYLMFILDEAEGIPDFVYDAVEGMDAGVIVVVLLLANPRTRASRFHRIRAQEYVQTFRISTLDHPNVVQGKQLIPGAATRDWVTRRLLNEDYCEIVAEHNADDDTFEVPWLPGKIFRPLPLCFWRILGKAPTTTADDVFCPLGRYEAAVVRAKEYRQIRARLTASMQGESLSPDEAGTLLLRVKELSHDPDGAAARIGVDVSRFGGDAGTIYDKFRGEIRRAARLARKDTNVYVRRIKADMADLVRRGAISIHVRIDGGGGFGGGVIDALKIDLEIRRGIEETLKARAGQDHNPDVPFFGLEEFKLYEVHFNAAPYDPKSFYNLITEMYYHGAEALRVYRLHQPPGTLEQDLTERRWTWGKLKGIEVKILTEKKDFRKVIMRSPDDGDGYVLAAAPDYLFRGKETRTTSDVATIEDLGLA